MNRFSKFLNYFHIFKTEVSDYFRYIFSFSHFKIYLAILAFLNILIWGGTFYIDKKIIDQQIALHYNVDFGIDYYGDISNIYIIPILGLFFTIFNTAFLAIVKKHKDFIFISHLLLSISIVTNLILITAIISIFLVNY